MSSCPKPDAPAAVAARPVPACGTNRGLPHRVRRPDPPPTVLLYDWDNTLVDAWAGVAAALNTVFTEFGMALWTAEDTKSRARLSVRESFPPLFGTRWEQARDLFFANFRDRHLEHLRPMQGAAEALAAGTPWPQGVVSNKAGDFLRAEVAHLGWADHFRVVVGAGDATADKPDPAPIHLALQQLGYRADASVWYLGDTTLDMQTARAAGVTAVLIGDAGHDLGIADAAPDIHFPSAHDLAAHFRVLA
jgi:phosphoglycolate phosphatase